MKGELYYSFKAPKQPVRFFALEATFNTISRTGQVVDSGLVVRRKPIT